MKYILGIATLFYALIVSPASAQATGLTSQQANSLIAVVQSSPGTPANVFVSLITSFSNITINQATSLITVVQSAPGVPANAFVNLLISFTNDTSTTQTTPSATTQNTTSTITQATSQVVTQSTTPPTQSFLPSLSAIKYAGYDNQRVSAGASNVKIGSFTLSTNVGVTITSIYLDIVGNTNVTNVVLQDHLTGNLLTNEVRTTSTMLTDNNFLVNLQIPAGETRTISIHGNIPSGVTGSIQAILNSKTGGNIMSSGIGISLAVAVPLQITTVIDTTPKTTFSFNGNENASNTYMAKVGDIVRLGWNTQYSYGGTCTASGAWSGEKIEGNSENIIFTQAGTFDYTLTCINSNTGETGTKTATIIVN